MSTLPSFYPAPGSVRPQVTFSWLTSWTVSKTLLPVVTLGLQRLWEISVLEEPAKMKKKPLNLGLEDELSTQLRDIIVGWDEIEIEVVSFSTRELCLDQWAHTRLLLMGGRRNDGWAEKIVACELHLSEQHSVGYVGSNFLAVVQCSMAVSCSAHYDHGRGQTCYQHGPPGSSKIFVMFKC